MQLIDGKKVSQDILNLIQSEVTELKNKTGRVPGLAAILVGDNPASQVYVNSKIKACGKVAINSEVVKLPGTVSEDELLRVIESFNQNDNFDGILVQLPLPKHISESRVIEAVSPLKDVDGFHPVNVGKLVLGLDTLFPCTPAGIQELLKAYKIETVGQHVVVIGRSNIVGKPIANIMLQKKSFANSVVTVCHSAAKDLMSITRSADILIAAIGVADFVTADMVKDGVVVIDVGINRVADSSPKGYKIKGDVNFDEVAPKSSYITPVPGGVGPMTIAMLISNTLKSFKTKMRLNYE
ncbi:MAG: bifunctional methylenetetrahydrofolate dehydrogenase/methenyltetrahydrofolate cyclohydrolase FolD [Ignavibacteriaceae bacterium]|nr:bifunctional methylenetetrahydrofolate dehydrogenase/methenyltetrahydrofolate cyclohydrolase FolD [Ignavibacteriaceae bacterium]